MDINEFMEQDILVFLDEQLDKEAGGPAVYSQVPRQRVLTKNYEKEFFAALDANDMNAAKNVLHELKQEFDAIPNGVTEKEDVKALMMDLYEKFKSHIETNDIFSAVDSTLGGDKSAMKPASATVSAAEKTASTTATSIATPPSKGSTLKEGTDTQSNTQKNDTDTSQTGAPRAPALLQAPTPPQAMASARTDTAEESAFSGANAILDTIPSLLENGKVAEAVQEYKRAKHDLLGLEKHIPQELASRFVQTYGEIRNAMAHVVKKTKRKEDPGRDSAEKRASTAKERDILPPLPEGPGLDGRRDTPVSRNDMDHDILLQLEREKRSLDAALHANDLKSAMQGYKRMRSLAMHISDKRLAQKTSEKMRRIHTIIDTLRSHDTSDERPLKTPVP